MELKKQQEAKHKKHEHKHKHHKSESKKEFEKKVKKSDDSNEEAASGQYTQKMQSLIQKTKVDEKEVAPKTAVKSDKKKSDSETKKEAK